MKRIFPFAAACLMLTGCGAQQAKQKHSRDVFAMDTYMNLTAYGNDSVNETLTHLLGTCRENTVLLAHNPLWFRSYAKWGAALTLSGHVHGGAVRLPLIGGLLSPERAFFPPYDKGYYTDGRHDMIVSGGLGKLRLFNPPEICLITPKTD